MFWGNQDQKTINNVCWLLKSNILNVDCFLFLEWSRIGLHNTMSIFLYYKYIVVLCESSWFFAHIANIGGVQVNCRGRR